MIKLIQEPTAGLYIVKDLLFPTNQCGPGYLLFIFKYKRKSFPPSTKENPLLFSIWSLNHWWREHAFSQVKSKSTLSLSLPPQNESDLCLRHSNSQDCRASSTSWFIHTYTTFAENQQFNPTLLPCFIAMFLLMSYGEKLRVAFLSDSVWIPNLLWASSSTTIQIRPKKCNAQLVYILNWEELAKNKTSFSLTHKGSSFDNISNLKIKAKKKKPLLINLLFLTYIKSFWP